MLDVGGMVADTQAGRKAKAVTTETQPAVAFAFAKAMADSGHGELQMDLAQRWE
jgi:hypothetical protein